MSLFITAPMEAIPVPAASLDPAAVERRSGSGSGRDREEGGELSIADISELQLQLDQDLQDIQIDVMHSPKWRPHSRVVLNSRRLFFPTHSHSPAQIAPGLCVFAPPPPPPLPKPNILAARLLRQALSLSERMANGGSSSMLMGVEMQAFFDDASMLRGYSAEVLAAMEPSEALAFFLNLWHTLVLHGYLLLGPPRAILEASSFFNSVSYECGGDVFSVAELEHLVLRAPLSRPTIFGTSLIGYYALTVDILRSEVGRHKKAWINK
jgi:hypothetical protein